MKSPEKSGLFCVFLGTQTPINGGVNNIFRYSIYLLTTKLLWMSDRPLNLICL